MKIIKITLLSMAALLLFITSAPAHAGKLHLVLNGKSFHVDSDYGWNENNYGLGIEYEFNSRSRWIKVAMANGFHDSQDNISYMAGAGLHRRLLVTDRFADLYLDAGINAFFMTRQDINNNRPFLGLLPSVTLGNRYGGINLSYVPKQAVHRFAKANMVDPNIDGVFFLQVKFCLDSLLRK